MLQPRIELGPKRWQRSILPLNYCSLTNNIMTVSHLATKFTYGHYLILIIIYLLLFIYIILLMT